MRQGVQRGTGVLCMEQHTSPSGGPTVALAAAPPEQDIGTMRGAQTTAHHTRTSHGPPAGRTSAPMREELGQVAARALSSFSHLRGGAQALGSDRGARVPGPQPGCQGPIWHVITSVQAQKRTRPWRSTLYSTYGSPCAASARHTLPPCGTRRCVVDDSSPKRTTLVDKSSSAKNRRAQLLRASLGSSGQALPGCTGPPGGKNGIKGTP